MHYHAMELFVKINMLLNSIAADCVNADIYIAIDYLALCVVEGDDVGVIIVAKVLAVYLKYFLVIAEHVAQLAYCVAVACCYSTQPPRSIATAQTGEGYGVGMVGEHGMSW